jgi:hypothetical protein
MDNYKPIKGEDSAASAIAFILAQGGLAIIVIVAVLLSA